MPYERAVQISPLVAVNCYVFITLITRKILFQLETRFRLRIDDSSSGDLLEDTSYWYELISGQRGFDLDDHISFP